MSWDFRALESLESLESIHTEGFILQDIVVVIYVMYKQYLFVH